MTHYLFRLTKLFLAFLTSTTMGSASEYHPFKIKYRYENGLAQPKQEFSREITIMQWNICFLPSNYPILYGGVKESKERVDAVAKFIIDADADIVALQEAHDGAAIKALIKLLKPYYAYIYYDIGPSTPFEIEEIIPPFFNSGLMILSKYPVKDLSFKSFDYIGMQWQINKGFFGFTILHQDKELMHLYATHLQPYDEDKDHEIREKELKEIVQAIEKHRSQKKSPLPYIVFGDLNIPWGSPEYGASSMHTFFDEAYTKDIEFATPKNCTVTDFLIDYRENKLKTEYLQCLDNSETYGEYNPYATIVDYFLAYKKNPPINFHTATLETFPTNFNTCGDDALEALSDHKALLTKINL